VLGGASMRGDVAIRAQLLHQLASEVGVRLDAKDRGLFRTTKVSRKRGVQ
jgi:hypothetical protein